MSSRPFSIRRKGSQVGSGLGTMFAVDVGGTFTDVASLRAGQITISKVPSDPSHPGTPVIEGARELSVADAVVFNHASTHGLNAIITRNLPKVAFITTEGFRDILDAGTVMRTWEHITNPAWRRSFGDARHPIVPRYLRRGVRERIAFDGSVAVPLDEDHVRQQLAVLGRCRVQGIALCLLNAYVNGQHEERIRELVREELGAVTVSLSSEVSPIAKEYQRGSTTVVDVIMKLIYADYILQLRAGLEAIGFRGELNFGESSGTLIAADFAMQQPHRVVYSGPAGGTSASSRLGEQLGRENLLCADVGGTSCDISIVTRSRPYLNLSYELEPDLHVNALAIDISSIGAGGGSVVSTNSVGELRVGPDSAGAKPGPACYGLGGVRPTMTDLAALIGILDPKSFAGGRIALSITAAEAAVRNLDVDLEFPERIRSAWLLGLNNIVEGLFGVALRRGADPREYALMAYGAAGPMMLPSILSDSHVKEVVVPPFPGHFSALGLLTGLPVYADSQTEYAPLAPASAPMIDALLTSMTRRLQARVPAEPGAMTVARSIDARLFGQNAATPFIPIPDGPVTARTVPLLVEHFHDEYQLRNGNAFRSMPVEVVAFRVQITVQTEPFRFPELAPRGGRRLTPRTRATIRHLYGEPVDVPVYQRDDLRAYDAIDGPAIVREAASTTFVTAAQHLSVGPFAEMVISEAHHT